MNGAKHIKQLTNSEAKELRIKLIEQQDGLCAITGRKMNKPVLDHEHRRGFLLSRSGQVRGVINSDVNQLLGKVEYAARNYNIQFDELPEVLRGIASYLERPLLPYIHHTEKPKESIVKVSSYKKLGFIILRNGDKLPSWWGYVKRNGKNTQKLSKRLKALYDKYGLEPEFYAS